jgi:hypothetical protein
MQENNSLTPGVFAFGGDYYTTGTAALRGVAAGFTAAILVKLDLTVVAADITYALFGSGDATHGWGIGYRYTAASAQHELVCTAYDSNAASFVEAAVVVEGIEDFAYKSQLIVLRYDGTATTRALQCFLNGRVAGAGTFGAAQSYRPSISAAKLGSPTVPAFANPITANSMVLGCAYAATALTPTVLAEQWEICRATNSMVDLGSPNVWWSRPGINNPHDYTNLWSASRGNNGIGNQDVGILFAFLANTIWVDEIAGMQLTNGGSCLVRATQF